MMDEETVLQIVDEFLSSLEPLDTQSTALMQFLKAKGIANEEELTPFLEQAGNASNVRWLAARVRIKSLISSAMKTEEPQPIETPTERQQTSKTESAQQKETSPERREESHDHKNTDEPRPASQELRAPGKNQTDQKKDEPIPVQAVAATSEKDEPKEDRVVPSKSNTKADAA